MNEEQILIMLEELLTAIRWDSDPVLTRAEVLEAVRLRRQGVCQHEFGEIRHGNDRYRYRYCRKCNFEEEV